MVSVRWSALARGPVKRHLAPDDAERAAIAKALDLNALERLEADVTVSPWLDGAEVKARFAARVVQTCGVTLEPFETALDGAFRVRVLPAGSPNAPVGEPEEIDPEAEDPPDVIEGEAIDLSALVVEHLSLEIDPFPRKPGAVFETPAARDEASPFAVLRLLKPPDSVS